MEPCEGRAEGHSPFPLPAGQDMQPLDTAQDTVGSAHVQLFVCQDPKVFLRRAALNEFYSQASLPSPRESL